MSFASESLTLCETAIKALLTDRLASYSVGGKQYNYQDLDTLWKMRRELSQEVTRETNNGLSLAVMNSSGSAQVGGRFIIQ